MANTVSVDYITKVVEIEVNDNETESLAAMTAVNAAKRAEQAKDNANTAANAAAESAAAAAKIVDVGVDPTLTVPDSAADAKAAGDIFDTFAGKFTLTETAGFFNPNGTVTSATENQEVYTDKITAYPGEKFVCRQMLPASNSMWGAYVVWDAYDAVVANRTNLYNSTGTKKEATITMPERAAKVAFCYRTFGNANTFSVRKSSDMVLSTLKTEFLDDASEEKLVYSKTFTQQGYLNQSYGLNPGLYKIDATNVATNKTLKVICKQKNPNNPIGCAYIKAGEFGYLRLTKPTYSISVALSAYTSGDSDSISIYRLGQPIAQKNLMTGTGKIFAGVVDVPEVVNGMYLDGYITSLNRICTKPYAVSGTFEISLSNYTDYKFACVVLNNRDDMKTLNDSGWQSSSYAITVDANCCFAIVIARVDNANFTPAELSSIGLKVTSDCYYKTALTVEEAHEMQANFATRGDIENAETRSDLGAFAGRFKPCYDHLFVNTPLYKAIPHESLYHIRISKSLGFNVIEANIAKTSDGVFIVNHLASGKFGNYFHHVDGETDISGIAIDSVTWSWIEENVRYNCTTAKYQTRPCRLEEFLSECKQNNIIPFATSRDIDAIKIVEDYMGKGNYIAYGGARADCPSAFIYHWVTLTTKADILAYCQSVGKPFIYGMSNPSSFSDSDLQDIVNTLHENGFWIGTSYADTDWHKYSAMGFDFNGTQQLVNRIETGNLHNINSMLGFSGFTYTNASESSGVLTFASDGTISPDIDNTTYPLSMIDIEMWFDGSITVPRIGEFIGATYISDGSKAVFVAVPIINGSPKVTLSVTSGTKIFDLHYKASVC